MENCWRQRWIEDADVLGSRAEDTDARHQHQPSGSSLRSAGLFSRQQIPGPCESARHVGRWYLGRRWTQPLVTKLADDQDRAETTEYAFSSDGRWFASGYKNGNIRLWNPQTWSRERLLIGNTQNVHALAFSPDSRWLAVGGDDAAVRLWSLDGEPSATILRGDTGAVFSLAFTADGETVAVGSVDGTVKFWNIKARREVVTIKAHDSAVCAIAFSPGGSTMATASVDLTMRLWKAPGFDETDR